MTLRGAEIVSIPAQNTLEFLQAAFAHYAQGQLFAIARDDVNLGEYGFDIVRADLPAATTGWGQLSYTPNMSDDPAQVAFTSGTEGRPKAIMISHRNLADVVMRLNEVMQVTADIREYIGVPVTYSFGLGRVRAVAAAGGRFFLPDRFDPLQIRQMLEDDAINAISAVPSLWRAVLMAPDAIGAVGEKLRWIEIGSQYMSASDKAALKQLFPNARIVQHYGLTEASRTTFLVISECDGETLESVGQATGSAAVRITPEGAIAIRGDHVALGQVEAGGAFSSLTTDGWLVTRDRGDIRDGFLYYGGRLDDQINISGIKLAAEALETDIAALVPVAAGHFAVTGVPDTQRGEAVLLATLADGAGKAPLILEAARVVLRQRGIDPGGILKTTVLDTFPRTATHKIRRKEIAASYAPDAPRTPTSAHTATQSNSEKKLAECWAKVVGTDDIGPDQSFFDLGGDSLSSVQIGLVMESDGFARTVVRATLEGRPLAEVAALMGTAQADSTAALPDLTVQSWALSITRGIMVLSVLLSHWGAGLFGRLGLDSLLNEVLNIVYRMGTPGFAAVFGMGVGFFMLPGLATRRASVMARVRASFLLVVSGMILLALVKLGLATLRGTEIDVGRVGTAFYGVLGYYLIMLGTARWWLLALARLRAPQMSLWALALGSWIAWQVTGPLITSAPQDNLLEWPRLMASAGYNVFKMTSVAAAGAAIGIWLARTSDPLPQAGRRLRWIGGLGALMAICILVQSYGTDVFATRGGGGAYVSLPGLALYLMLAALFLGCAIALVRRWAALPQVLQLPLRLLIVTGGLALPIYVFHQLVFPVRNILMALGAPGSLALLVAMGSFLAAMGYAGRRLYRMYF